MSDFTSEGFESLPSLYQDNGEVRNLADWTEEALNDHYAIYLNFIQGDIMPRAREEASRMLAHVAFELMYRSGVFDERK